MNQRGSHLRHRFDANWMHVRRAFYAHRRILPVDLCGPQGLGAKIVWCLEIALFCERSGLYPLFKFSHPGLPTNENYFAVYFESKIQRKSHSGDYIRINHIADLRLNENYNKLLNLQTAHRLLMTHLHPRPDVQECVDAFVRTNLGDGEVLAVHYRGTDKRSEAPPVFVSDVLLAIRTKLKQRPTLCKIFATSDDATFIECLQRADLPVPVVVRADSARSVDGLAVHTRDGVDKSNVVRDAVLNMLIVARCAELIKTSSILTAISILYSPSMPYQYLNKPFSETLWFPESILTKGR